MKFENYFLAYEKKLLSLADAISSCYDEWLNCDDSFRSNVLYGQFKQLESSATFHFMCDSGYQFDFVDGRYRWIKKDGD